MQRNLCCSRGISRYYWFVVEATTFCQFSVQLIPPELVHAYPRRMLNIHPALLPSFGGAGMYGQRVHRAVVGSGACCRVQT